MTDDDSRSRRGGIPRGLSETGPVLFSYGFRPFFLGAAVWAILAMALWLAALSGALEIAAVYGPAQWHAHEMLFGFGPAVLTGYLMTSVPNWSGRMPVSGRPLALVFSVWCAGRLALAAMGAVGPVAAVAIDALFLPLVFLIATREIVAGRKWRDLRLVAVLAALSAANIAFHAAVLSGGDAGLPARLAAGLYVLLIAMVGGRMVPSFTRPRLKARGVSAMPAPFGAVDRLAVALSLPALAGWAVLPGSELTAVIAIAAAGAQAVRLLRWRGWLIGGEPLVLSLHAAYGFVPLGLFAVALAATGHLPATDALHVLTVGAMGGMMLAVMMRATRGHTGRPIAGSWLTGLASLSLFAAACLRPLAGLLPDQATLLYALAGAGWIAAFSLFIVEYGPMLAFVRRERLG